MKSPFVEKNERKFWVRNLFQGKSFLISSIVSVWHCNWRTMCSTCSFSSFNWPFSRINRWNTFFYPKQNSIWCFSIENSKEIYENFLFRLIWIVWFDIEMWDSIVDHRFWLCFSFHWTVRFVDEIFCLNVELFKLRFSFDN